MADGMQVVSEIPVLAETHARMQQCKLQSTTHFLKAHAALDCRRSDFTQVSRSDLITPTRLDPMCHPHIASSRPLVDKLD